MNLFALQHTILLHGQVGFWDEVAYVVAGVIGVAVFVAMVIARMKTTKE